MTVELDSGKVPLLATYRGPAAEAAELRLFWSSFAWQREPVPPMVLVHDSLAAAARYPDRIAAAASYYGTRLINDVEESPHLSYGQTKGELYIACAEYDHLAPFGMVEKLKGYLDKSGATGEIEIYPDVQHGFAFPERSVYDKLAAEQHWERMISLYRRTLG